MRSFVKIKPLRNGEVYKFSHCHEFYVANVSFNPIRENKILANISEFTEMKLHHFIKYLCAKRACALIRDNTVIWLSRLN